MATKKKKTVGENLAIKVVLDRSGSMRSVMDETMGVFNAYVDRMKKETPTAKLSLTIFDSESVDVVYGFLPIDNVPHLNASVYIPRAWTPLYDAIGKGVADLETQAADRKALVVLTDGLENASREFTREVVKKLLDEKQESGWLVIFLGANFDAISVGSTFGTKLGSTMTFDPGKVKSTMSAAARATTAYASASNSAVGQKAAMFTDTERKASAKGDGGTTF